APLDARTVVFVVTDGSGHAQSVPASTNLSGQAELSSLTLPLGQYSITAHFGDTVQLPSGSIALADPDHNAATPARARLTVTPAQATVAFSNLSATYDGTPHPASATVSPNWCGPVALSYSDGINPPTQSPPTLAGSYTVQGSLGNGNCQFASGTATSATL